MAVEPGVYVIECVPTRQIYIGSGMNWKLRLQRHFQRLRAKHHPNKALQVAWDKHGPTSFKARLLEACQTHQQLAVAETKWITKLRANLIGFNARARGLLPGITHGLTHSPTFKSWESMLQRCTNKNSPDYKNYGSRGVKVCRRWRSFEAFLADMGTRPEGTSLDRYPNKYGNYQPNNCRWATPSQQQRNLRCNLYATYQGVTKLAVDWANETGIPVGVLRRRINQGAEGPTLFAPTYNSFKGVKDADGKMPKRYRVPSNRGMKFTAHGKTMTLSQWAVELGIERGTLQQRIVKYKIPIEKALTPAPLKTGKSGPRKGISMITAFGKTQSLTAWSRETGLSLSTIRNRLYRAKLPPEQALNLRS